MITIVLSEEEVEDSLSDLREKRPLRARASQSERSRLRKLVHSREEELIRRQVEQERSERFVGRVLNPDLGLALPRALLSSGNIIEATSLADVDILGVLGRRTRLLGREGDG